MQFKNLTNKTLIQIQKYVDKIKLTFSDGTEFVYEGLLFETLIPGLSHKVNMINFETSIGYKGLTTLRSLGLDPKDYSQLLISMNNSTEEWKSELICIIKNEING